MLSACDLYKTYRRNAEKVPVLCGLDLEASAGEFLCVVGASGSGKSTLLHLLGTLDQPLPGDVTGDPRGHGQGETHGARPPWHKVSRSGCGDRP